MLHMGKMLKRLIKDERGLETVEYAVIAALITLAAIAAITLVGTNVAGKFDTLNTNLK